MNHIIVTREIAERVLSGNTQLSDPCVICGEKFSSDDCPHTVMQTEDIIKRVRRMPKAQRERLFTK